MSVTASSSCLPGCAVSSYHQQAGVGLLPERQRVGKGQDGRGIDQNPIEIAGKTLENIGNRRRLQKLCRIGPHLSRRQQVPAQGLDTPNLREGVDSSGRDTR